MRNEAHNNGQEGFTLLELLLAMVLSVIVITAMSAVFRSVIDSSIAVDSEVLVNQEGRVLLSILQKDLSSLVVSNSTKTDSDDSTMNFSMSTGEISAGDTFLTFTTTNDLYAQNATASPLNHVEYKLEEEDEGLFSLVRSNREFAHLEGDWEPRELKISEKLKSVEIEVEEAGSGMTVGNEEILQAKSIEIVFSLLDVENVREYRLFVPVNPAIVELTEKSD
ncbi:type II secretion system protein J [Desulfovibrio sp. JC022]|uniref:PulJ/GspJ family protein n=1 Tax=Desulfovibrio sp. JC022 TaxID=2593642 RepID=UPI0013CF4E5F|nr:prepilin-type N-terminal cleavage/methylation domain-containing protein [Desulfovibrio sp. JC022]NDV24934.1 prepilin-type N-terminal cleavage/methylation domain-containing protein [Desulfovibrio sp. JC022]